MKLAEALVERKAAQEKIGELHERLQRVTLVQEGEAPAEEPGALLQELDSVARRLEALIIAINRTNIAAPVADGRSIMEAIAQRDVLRMRMGVYDTILRASGNQHFRTRGSEIKFVATMDIARAQRERDRLAQAYRELDSAIQAANWNTELVE